MANSQTYKVNGSRNSTYTIELVVTEDSVDIASNSSVVSWNFVLKSTTYYFSTIGMTAIVNLDGDDVLDDYKQRSISKNSTLSLGSGTKTIVHDSNGKKTINVNASLTMNATDSYLPREYLYKQSDF